MSPKTLFLLITTIITALFLQTSCTYNEEKAAQKRYDDITGDSLDTSFNDSIPALKNDSFARNEDKAVKTSSTENGSTTSAYAGSTTGTGPGGGSEDATPLKK